MSGALLDFSVQPGVLSPASEIAARRELPKEYSTPAVDLIQLNDAWLETRMCVAITTSGKYVVDTLRVRRQAEENGYHFVGPYELELPEHKTLRMGGAFVLAGLPTGRNYFHWLLEAVARTVIARRHVDADIRCLVPEIRGMERATLNMVGVHDALIEIIPDATMLQVDQLIIAPRGLVSSVKILPAATDALRVGVQWDDAPATDRIFISRSSARRRRIANEKDVSSLLERHGFQTVATETLSPDDQRALFAKASVIAGMHGAGLTNTVFARPGATLIELQPPRLDTARTILYWNFAAACEQRYVQVVCPEAPGQDDRPLSERDIYVNINHLDTVLGRTLGSPF